YQPLNPSADTIRVLYFENFKKHSEPIRCRLVHVEFGQRPKYNALSYTWGDESTKYDIYVDGQKVQVGFNLFDALKSLRRRKGGIPIWADAICINQQDIPERNRQIRIMAHIYARAVKVLVFLGIQSPSLDMDEEERYRLLSHHPYWERVWIVQEIFKARNIEVCFDSERLRWKDFITNLDELVSRTNKPHKFDRHLRLKYEHNQTLLFLLKAYRSSKCKDPRDKIYGFVGLASDCHRFPIDYSKTTYEVWKDTVTFISRQPRYDAWNMARIGSLIKRLL
ncbi:HET-domain-containing protein, partial [Aaosphaeria arxii CBS 175.79]